MKRHRQNMIQDCVHDKQAVPGYFPQAANVIVINLQDRGTVTSSKNGPSANGLNTMDSF